MALKDFLTRICIMKRMMILKLSQFKIQVLYGSADTFLFRRTGI
ncbi:Uncharacterized protein BM_BM8602 [Brugia malayi]|uniref:Bm8602 n=1 Tax=Brugia malayi TaxID=6279 RepID=A0A0K0JWE4_BRUMA|nr:Uncharacterized protein BM_BM8602 [Brugia malayi]CRZ22521.1 Bm8602 [Brugia malayi]VIO87773.1 Uncharacterized protein BM_BM8602 [Brugia malayi]